MRETNSIGNDKRGVMKFLREQGIKPNAANVDKFQRDLSRSPSQVERDVARHREIERARGLPSTVDSRGRDMKEVARRIVRKELDSRPKRK